MFFGIEVKAGRVGRLAPEQKEWLEKLVAHGGIAIVARSLED
jgi:phage I-like protein